MAIGDEHTITIGAYEKALVEVNGDGDVGDAVAPYQLGLMTDEPLAAETAEGATSRSGISLWKRITNKLIDVKALLTTIDVDTSSLAGCVDGGEIQVDVVSMPLSVDLDIEAADLVGAFTDAPSTDEEDATSRSPVSLLKGAKNYLRTIAAGITVSTSALPSGAATETTLAAVESAVDGLEASATSIDGKITACNTGAVILAAPADGTYIGDVKAPLDAYNLVPNDMQADQALTVDATAGGVQFSAFHADTTHVEFDIQTADVRVTFDDSAPTSTNGHLLPVGYQDTWSKAKASAAKFIRTGATSAVVHASQFKGA